MKDASSSSSNCNPLSKTKLHFGKSDRLASSIILNLLQWPLRTPSCSDICSYQSNADTANWMGKLVQTLGKSSNLTLRDLVLPGTHDSASSSIHGLKPFAGVGRTQSATIQEQLELGARYLDIRVAASSTVNGDISIWHGLLEGNPLQSTVLDDINSFMAKHPDEVVLLELVPEHGRPFPTLAKQQCLQMIHDTLGDRVLRGRQAIRAIRKTPLRQLLRTNSAPKRLLIVILNDRMWNDENEEEDLGLSVDEVMSLYGFVRRGHTLRNPWHDTKEIDELFGKNLGLIDEFGEDKRFLICNQFLCTPGVKNGLEFLGTLTGANSLQPVSHACDLYQCGALDYFLCDHAERPWNIVSLDYFDLCPELVDYLICLNWKACEVNLTVHVAALMIDGVVQDVTRLCRSLIRRRCVLFVVDSETDLNIPEGSCSRLVVAYTFTVWGAMKHFVAEFDTSQCRTPIILSPFSCNRDMFCTELSSDTTRSRGIVCNGQIAQTCSSDHLEGQIPVAFDITPSGCKFELV